MSVRKKINCIKANAELLRTSKSGMTRWFKISDELKNCLTVRGLPDSYGRLGMKFCKDGSLMIGDGRPGVEAFITFVRENNFH